MIFGLRSSSFTTTVGHRVGQYAELGAIIRLATYTWLIHFESWLLTTCVIEHVRAYIRSPVLRGIVRDPAQSTRWIFSDSPPFWTIIFSVWHWTTQIMSLIFLKHSFPLSWVFVELRVVPQLLCWYSNWLKSTQLSVPGDLCPLLAIQLCTYNMGLVSRGLEHPYPLQLTLSHITASDEGHKAQPQA